MPRLFHQLLTQTADKCPKSLALQHKKSELSYQQLNEQVAQIAAQLVKLRLPVNARVAIYLPKQVEAVVSYFACSLAAGVFVPVNPLLKGPQVQYILDDCEVTILITSLSRYQQMSEHFDSAKSVKQVILTDCSPEQKPANCICWQELQSQPQPPLQQLPQRISQDMAAILYTSGSTGNPKGVVLSHGNLVAGAKSVAQYLENHQQDKLLAVLPFSFDYGLSQLTTAFISGACVVLMEYLLPRDVIRAVADYRITGLAAVPPLWIQLAELEWPSLAQSNLRYITNSGGAMPQATLSSLKEKLPQTQPYLMYGLTEAFRSTYLDPEEISKRPTSMGKAIPDAEILVINQQGKEAQAGEEGELVHRGPHVALGYWNSPQKTAQRFKPLPQSLNQGLIPQIAVWSGDTVVKDEEGFLYFIGRKDDMIKSSGYRVSPSEIEECVYQHDMVSEVAAIGVPHPSLGQAILLVVKAHDETAFDEKTLLAFCKKQLPNFMHPKAIQLSDSLPRNPNGKINRKRLSDQYSDMFS